MLIALPISPLMIKARRTGCGPRKLAWADRPNHDIASGGPGRSAHAVLHLDPLPLVCYEASSPTRRDTRFRPARPAAGQHTGVLSGPMCRQSGFGAIDSPFGMQPKVLLHLRRIFTTCSKAGAETADQKHGGHSCKQDK